MDLECKINDQYEENEDSSIHDKEIFETNNIEQYLNQKDQPIL